MLDEPGIFVMGTDTGVGKTVVGGRDRACGAAPRGAASRPSSRPRPADGSRSGDAEFVPR